MNRILISIGFWMLIFGMSCAISKKENERMDKILSQQSNLVEIKIGDSLTSDMLSNYEIRAIQKLEEFYDYANLISNNDYRESIKSEIRISAQGLFFDSNEQVNPFDPVTVEEKSVEMLLMDIQDAADDHEMSISSIEIVTPLRETSSNRYDGKISFQLAIGQEHDQKIIVKSAMISLRKIEKTIGTETVKIWEVFLERIE